jgi:hypothetical protein
MHPTNISLHYPTEHDAVVAGDLQALSQVVGDLVSSGDLTQNCGFMGVETCFAVPQLLQYLFCGIDGIIDLRPHLLILPYLIFVYLHFSVIDPYHPLHTLQLLPGRLKSVFYRGEVEQGVLFGAIKLSELML